MTATDTATAVVAEHKLTLSTDLAPAGLGRPAQFRVACESGCNLDKDAVWPGGWFPGHVWPILADALVDEGLLAPDAQPLFPDAAGTMYRLPEMDRLVVALNAAVGRSPDVDLVPAGFYPSDHPEPPF